MRLRIFALTLFLFLPMFSALGFEEQDAAAGSSDAPLTVREKQLLDRIDKLEQRLAAMETKQTKPEPLAPSGPPVPQAEKAESKPEDKAVSSVKVYGRVELDAIYSSRGTNPLDPRQFNGYSTAAGPENVSSSTFNPRFSVIGIEGSTKKGNQSLDAKVEVDFYSTDAANLFTPRLRLAYVDYAYKDTKATVGMDWVPVAALLPDLMDFSIMGYSGNLWQRIPQITLRQKFAKHWEILGSAFRFERGFTLQPSPLVKDPFTDPVKAPFIGTRIAYQHWGVGDAGMIAVSGAYRQFHLPGIDNAIKSDLISLELAVPITNQLHWNSKIAHGQGLGDEFFRFGQAFNGTIPIKTTTGWTELTFAPYKRVSFAGGFGLDNPLGKDLTGISNNDLNYRRNERVYVDSVYDVFENFKVGFELNYLHTNWSNGQNFDGYQPMLSFFYTF